MTRRLAYKDLISGDWSASTRIAVGSTEKFKYYIHDDVSSLGTSITWTHWDGHEKFINDTFARIDNLIDLDFSRTFKKEDADIEIYRISPSYKIYGASDSKTVGLTTVIPSQSRQTGGYFQVQWLTDNVSTEYVQDYSTVTPQEAWTIAHEIGHALGLEHPAEDPWGSWHSTSDSIMSYNFIPAKVNAYFYSAPSFTQADINALMNLWGAENDSRAQSVTLNAIGTVSATQIASELSGLTSPEVKFEKQFNSQFSVNISTSSWSENIKVNSFIQGANVAQRLDAPQVDFSGSANQGSIIVGGSAADQIWAKAGWDFLEGGSGNDLIRAGNGRDVITGGLGADELHGDFGWNTFKSEQDGFSDLIAIKSDQFLSNWIYGKAGNNPNGEKADIIEGLDAIDQIKIIGVFTPDISVRAWATAHGVSGIGIYAGGALEALYTGTNLSVAQITAMTTGDGSAAAMANQISSYGWTGV